MKFREGKLGRGLAYKIVGGILVVYNGIMVLVLSTALTITEEDAELGSMYAKAILWLLIGALIFGIGVLKRKLWWRFSRYIRWAERTMDGSLTDLAKNVEVSERRAVIELKILMLKRKFPKCYIDAEKNAFITPYVLECQEMKQKREEHQKAVEKQQSEVSFVCPSCGGMNEGVSKTDVKCMFCDRPIIFAKRKPGR